MDKQDTPLKVTVCDLYENPEQYAGKIVAVRASASGNELSLDDFSNQKPCAAFMRLHLEFPRDVKPIPSFSLVPDAAFDEFFEKLRKGMNVIATFEGRFDPAFVWRDKKRIRVGRSIDKGYGRKHQYDGRIVVRELSDVLARPMPRR